MRSFQTKKKWWDALSSTPVLGFLAIILLVFAWSVLGFWGKMRETAKNRQIAENKIISLRADKEKLTGDIAKLGTDAGLEESIRDKFGLIKEGEGLIVIVDDKVKSEIPLEASTGGFWSFLTNWFK